MQMFTVKQKLPSLNDYIHALNINRYKGAQIKRDVQDVIIAAIREKQLQPVQNYPVFVEFQWHEKTRRRDLDNIASAKKYILDALQEAGVMAGDGQKQIKGFSDTFYVPDTWDGVTVGIFDNLN